MNKRLLITLTFIWATVFLALESNQVLSISDDAVHGMLSDRIATVKNNSMEVFTYAKRYPSDGLNQFYSQRGFQPVWVTSNGLRKKAAMVLKAIQDAEYEGLRVEDYFPRALDAQMAIILNTLADNRHLDPAQRVELDLNITKAFLLYITHLSTGRLNTETIKAGWRMKTKKIDALAVLESVLNSDQPEHLLERLGPQHAGYGRLKDALAQYQKILISGGWPELPDGSFMQKGDRSLRIALLRSRLIKSLDLDESDICDPMLFDETLEHGVRRFQRRHGLKVDGIVGPATLAALNVSVEERIRQIKLNLERWRWLPHDLGQKYVMVNIANSELNIIENDHIIKKMRAVVGRKTRRTPIFSDQITYLELNPYWHIPPKIARKDILPHIHNDPRYLIKQRIRVFENWKDQASEIDPLAIDWSLITENNFSFKLRQEPVPSNALGRIKFMFPNKFGVYIHDTPARNLFRRTKRYFSSGCIRIEKPVELADYLLRDNPQWPLDKLKAAINSQKREIIALPEPVAVYILYWTAWVEEDGSINFREDVYGRDKPLDTAWHHRFPDDGRIHAKPTQGSFSLSQRRMNTAELMTSRE